MRYAALCIVGNLEQRAPQRFFYYYNKLRFSKPTTHRAVGSSNLSGRANPAKFPQHYFRFVRSYATELGDETSCLNHAIITERPFELLTILRLTTRLVTR